MVRRRAGRARALGAERLRLLPGALRLAGRRAAVPRPARPPVARGGRRPRGPLADPLPGWWQRRQPVLPPAESRAGVDSQGTVTTIMKPQVHQVLATLGYGDAIGHEVLGIQPRPARRRLRVGDLRRHRGRAARAPDARLPRPGVVQLARQHPDPPLLDRVARLAHRLRAARPDGARLPQHHAARVLRGRAPAAGAPVLPRSARALGLRRAVRPGARRLGVQPAGTGGDGLPANRGPAGRPGLLAPRRRRPTGVSPPSSTTR